MARGRGRRSEHARRVPALAACLLAACSGSAFDGTVYRGEGYSFEVPKAPSHWSPIDVSDAALAYRDASHDAIVAINARCDQDGEDVPLRSLTDHLFLTFTDKETLSEEVFPFDGREAMRTVVAAKLDGVERRFEVWVVKKDGCVYDLHYISTPERFDAGREAFGAYAAGFSALPREEP